MAAAIEKRGGKFRATVWSNEDQRRIRKTFDTLHEARRWRSEAQVAVAAGTLQAPRSVTLREACEDWLIAAETGAVLTRGGKRYKPATIRTYRQSIALRVFDDLGTRKFTAITRRDLQTLVDKLHRQGRNPSTTQSAITPLKAVYRHAVRRGRVQTSPTIDLEMPAVGKRRDRIEDPKGAALLLAALPDQDRALWATAMYAGLRRGELRALKWDDLDLQAGRIHVRHGWDQVEGEITPKSGKVRTVPLVGTLKAILAAHRLRTGRSGVQLVFGQTGTIPFRPGLIRHRAIRSWEKAEGIPPAMALHECRHTFASLMIAAGVNAKALCEYMGHASVAYTFDRYGHLMPGNEDEAAGLLDAYLRTADGTAR